MKEVRVAVLGMGFIGKVHTYAYKTLPLFYENLPYRIKLAGVYNRTLSTAERAREEYGFEFATDNLDEIFFCGKLDAVSICTPNFQHKECILKAIQNGVHIYCEKPLAADDNEAEDIKEALEDKNLVHRIVFHNRFFAAVMRAKEIIDEGRLGRIFSFNVTYQHPSNVDSNKKYDWKFEKKYTCGGVLFDMGSHVLDMLYYLLGKYQSLFARTQTAHSKRLDCSGKVCNVEVEDAAYLVAQMENGAEGTIHISKIATGTNDEFVVEIFGEKGALKFDLMDPNWVWFYDNTLPDTPLGGDKGFVKIESVQRYGKPGGSFPSPKLAGGWLRAHVHSLYRFLEGIHTGQGEKPDLYDGAYIQHIMQKAYESASSGRWLDV